jgi:hypothetical protein
LRWYQRLHMHSKEYDQESVSATLKHPSETIPVLTISSLSQYCEVTELIRQEWKKKANQRSGDRKGYVGEILPWFRGARKASYTLTPKLAREWIRYRKFYDRIYDLEDYYYDRFARFGRPFLGGVTPKDQIEWNYIMRHHEIPSRLLDWTKGSLIALSYATQRSLPSPNHLEEPSHQQACPSPPLEEEEEDDADTESAAVWMLEPRRLMEEATQHLPNSQAIRNIASREREVWSMRRDFFKDPDQCNQTDEELSNRSLWNISEYWDYPIPLIPSHISARVESHLSRFTLHSLNSFRNKEKQKIPDQDEGLDKFARKAYSQDTFWYLIKIVLPGKQLKNIARVLRMTGVGDMNFTQDLDGLSRELQMRAHLGFQDDQDGEPIDALDLT